MNASKKTKAKAKAAPSRKPKAKATARKRQAQQPARPMWQVIAAAALGAAAGYTFA